MQELMELIENAKSIVAGLMTQQKEVKNIKLILDAREKNLLDRESRVKSREDLVQERELELNKKAGKIDLALDLHAELSRVQQKSVDLDNERQRAMEKIEGLRKEAEATMQEARHLKEAAVSFQANLDKEKKEYRNRILQELMTKVNK